MDARFTIVTCSAAVKRFSHGAIVLLLVLAVSLSVPVAAAQPRVELLSKEDARQLFGMSRQQWGAQVARGVAAGMAIDRSSPPHMVGMQYNSPDVRGSIIATRLDYSRGEAKPLFIQLIIMYPPGGAQPPFTDAIATEAFNEAKRQMAPEFDVIGNIERIQGGVALFFMIRESR